MAGFVMLWLFERVEKVFVANVILWRYEQVNCTGVLWSTRGASG